MVLALINLIYFWIASLICYFYFSGFAFFSATWTMGLTFEIRTINTTYLYYNVPLKTILLSYAL